MKKLTIIVLLLLGFTTHAQSVQNSDSIKDLWGLPYVDVRGNSTMNYDLSLQEAPKFPGGDTALMQFLRKNIVYPSTEENVINAKDSIADAIAGLKKVLPPSQYAKYRAGQLNKIKTTPERQILIIFLVNEDGTISNIYCFPWPNGVTKLNGVPHAMDNYQNEALRVVKLMPKWIPGKWDNEPVKTVIHLSIPFYLSHSYE